MVRLGHQRAVQGDDIAVAEQLLGGDILAPKSLHHGVGPDIVGEDLAAEAGQDLGHPGADLAGPHHAHGPPVQVCPQQALQRKVPFPHPQVRLVQLAAQGQQQAHGVLGHGMRRVRGDPGDGESQLLGRHQVHLVEARRAQRDEFGAAPG